MLLWGRKKKITKKREGGERESEREREWKGKTLPSGQLLKESAGIPGQTTSLYVFSDAAGCFSLKYSTFNNYTVSIRNCSTSQLIFLLVMPQLLMTPGQGTEHCLAADPSG